MQLLKKTGAFLLAIGILIALIILIFRTPDIPLEKLLPVYTYKASRFFEIQGMQVHYRDEGPRDDKLPLVLLHGSGSSLHTWDSLVLLFPEKRCIRLDIPGFGITGPHPKADYSTQTTIKILEELLQYLNADSCIIAGNSMGGFIGWTYALDHQTVKKLVLIDAAGFSTGSASSNLGFRLAKMPIVNQLVKVITPRSLVRKSIEQSYGDPSKVSDAIVNRYFDLNCREGNRQAMIDRFKLPVSGDTARLREIKIPVLILWGQKDQVIPVANADKFAAILTNNQKIIYPKLGHVPMEEDPVKVAEAIRNWIRQ